MRANFWQHRKFALVDPSKAGDFPEPRTGQSTQNSLFSRNCFQIISFPRTGQSTQNSLFSRNCFQIISFPRTGQSTQNSLFQNREQDNPPKIFQKLFSNYFLFTIRTETCHVSCFDCNADTYCNTFQEEGGGHKHNRQNRNPTANN